MVRISVRIWKPSTSASVQMMTLFQRRLDRSKDDSSFAFLPCDLHAAAQDLHQVRDDGRLENAAVIRLQAVEDFAPHRHDALKFRIPGELDTSPSAESPSTI